MKKILKVAMISYHTCPLAVLGGKNTGGMNVYVHELTRELGRMNIHVDVYTRSQDEHVPHVVHDLGYGNRVVHIPAGAEIPLPKEELACFIDTFVENILEFTGAKGLEYDLIHSHYWMSGIVGLRLRKKWNVPVINMFHTLGEMKNRIAGLGEFEGDYRINGEKEVIENADQIIASTQAEVAQLQWLYEANAESITVVPPGVNTGRFYPIPQDEALEYIGIPKDQKTVLFVGRIEPLKGIDTLLQAISLIHMESGCINCQLIIIGGDHPDCSLENSPEMERLQEIRKKLGLGEEVRFLGKKGQKELPYYYSSADVVVVPSNYESFGMVALESMACGTPVIASQVGGLAFLVRDGETGFHVPNNDPRALARKIHELIVNEELRDKMSKNAIAYAEKNSWKKITAAIVDVYQRLIDKQDQDDLSNHTVH